MLTAIFFIIGSLLTIGMVCYQIYLNKLALSYVEEDCIALVHSIVEKIDDLEMLFNKKPINPSIVMLNNYLINNGNRDIGNSIIHRPVVFKLPEGFKWLRATITKSSPGLEAKPKILKDESCLQIEWNLLKKNEFIKLNSIIERYQRGNKNIDYRKIEKELSKLIKISYRINALNKIEKEDRKAIEGIRLSDIFNPVFAMIFLTSFIIIFLGLRPPVYREIFILEKGEKTLHIDTDPFGIDKITENEINYENKLKEFIRPEVKIENKKITIFESDPSNLPFGVMFFFSGLIVMIGEVFKKLRKIRLRKIINGKYLR